jgi:teichuronic acid biosynthesis glycosyltransferase TuaC
MSTRVLVLTSIYPWEKNPQDAVFVRQQVRNLTDAGVVCEVVVFRYCPPGVPASLWRLRYSTGLAARDEKRGFQIHTLFVGRPFSRDGDVIPRVAGTVVRYLERDAALSRTDIIYAHWLWPAGAAALDLRRRFGWPVAAIARGSEMHYWQTVNPHCRPHVARVIREADMVLANCDGLRDEARRIAPEITRPINVVYNGCDASWFAPAANRAAVRAALGVAAGTRLMLFCGSVIERKGIRNLVRAWSRHAAKRQDWRLAVVGRLVEPALVRELANGERVTIVGPVSHDRVAGWMQAADAYVQPSIHEGLANATMEAMATGLPVIATDTGGQCDLIENGRNGLLVPVEDPEALYAAFAAIAGDPERARRMGGCARETVIQRFSPATQIAKLAKLLRETASTPSACGAIAPIHAFDGGRIPATVPEEAPPRADVTVSSARRRRAATI